jgi:hypothetical protein
MPKTRYPNDIVLEGLDSPAVGVQELIIHPDGSVEIPWICPAASELILAVWAEISHQPFPVRIIAGQLYCG